MLLIANLVKDCHHLSFRVIMVYYGNVKRKHIWRTLCFQLHVEQHIIMSCCATQFCTLGNCDFIRALSHIAISLFVLLKQLHKKYNGEDLLCYHENYTFKIMNHLV